MYYEEKIIDGKLRCRTTPDGEWCIVHAQPQSDTVHSVVGDLRDDLHARDAARYRWLRDVGDENWVPMGKRVGVGGPQAIDAAIDAAIQSSVTLPAEAPQEPTIGDYVLATKYQDGHPADMWALGFYDGVRDDQGRHYVKDSSGKQIRGNGFRRVARIRCDVGRWLLEVAADQLERCPSGTVNLWTMLTPLAFDLSLDRESGQPAYPQAPDALRESHARLMEALEVAKNGLAWYRDAMPEADSGADDEAMEQIDAALAHAQEIQS